MSQKTKNNIPVSDLGSEAVSQSEIAQILGFKSAYPARRLIQSARRCSLGYLRWAQQACLETDLALKSNLPDPQRSLELLIMRFSEAAK